MTATVTALPGNLQWLGLAKEITPGVAAAAPTIFIPADSPKMATKETPLVDNGLRGTMGTTFGQVQGMANSELTYSSGLYSDSLFIHLLAALGVPDTITGTAPTVKHATALLNSSDGTHAAQPVTVTGFLYQADGTMAVMAGMAITDLKFTFKANERSKMDVAWVGFKPTFVPATVNTPSTVQEMPPWTVAVSVGGTPFPSTTGVSVDIKRGSKPVPVLNGSQNPATIYAGEVSVTGTIDSVYNGSTDPHLTNLLSNSQPALKVTTYAQGDATHPFTLQLSQIAYDSADPQGSNSGWMTMSSAFKAIDNVTDALDGKLSSIQASLVTSSVTPF